LPTYVTPDSKENRITGACRIERGLQVAATPHDHLRLRL
jgi:hypothetical protein